MSTELVRNEWGVILQDGELVELRWLASTSSMGDGGFMATLCLFAWEAEKARPRGLMIDALEFRHKFGEGVMAWRDAHIIPRYGAMGMTRFAFHVPAGAPGTVEAGGTPAVEGSATFPTGWFSTRAGANGWLADQR